MQGKLQDIEYWMPIKGYEELYEVSDKGNVRSFSKIVNRGSGSFLMPSRYLKKTLNPNGYLYVTLYGLRKPKTFSVHKLVANTHIGESNLVVDHINGDKSDNRLSNLRLVTQRANVTSSLNKHSDCVGIYKFKDKWVSRIYKDGVRKYLGRFSSENEASLAYKKYLYAS